MCRGHGDDATYRVRTCWIAVPTLELLAGVSVIAFFARFLLSEVKKVETIKKLIRRWWEWMATKHVQVDEVAHAGNIVRESLEVAVLQVPGHTETSSSSESPVQTAQEKHDISERRG